MRFNLNQMKKIIFACFLLCLTVISFGQTPTVGDYRSVITGTWSTVSTWQVRDGSGNWTTPSVPPTSTNNVYIQAGNTVTVDIAGVCNDLHLNNTSGSLVIGANSVSVSGKLRAYTGTAIITSIDDVFYTQTAVNSGLSVSLVTSTTGALRFVGATRTIIASTDWGSNGTNNLGFVEFSLDAGATGTLVQGLKTKKIRISSGIVSAGSSNTMVTGTGATDSFVVKSGAKFITARAATQNAIGSSSSAPNALIVIEANATLEFTANCQLDTKSFINNGTVIYSGAGVQNFVVARSGTIAGTDSLNKYVNLVITGTSTSSAKTIFAGGTVTVSDTLRIEGQFSASASAINLGSVASKLTYGANATLVFNSTTATWTLPITSVEWPFTGGPKNVEIRRNKVQFVSTSVGGSRVITGSLILNGGTFFINSGDTLTMANNSNLIRKSASSILDWTSNSPGYYVIGTSVGDQVNVIIDANTTVIENGSGELKPQISYGKINLNIASGSNYIGGNGRTIYNFINSGVLALVAPTGTSSFTIKGNISGNGTVSGQDSVNITIDSANTGSTQILRFTNGSNKVRNLVFDRVGGTLTSAAPFNVQRSFTLRNGTFNDGGFVDTVKGSITRGTTTTSNHVSGVGGKIVASASSLDPGQRAIDSLSFGNLEIAGNYTCGGFTVTGDLTLASGIANCNSNTILVYGNIFGTGSQTGTGRVKMIGAAKTISGATFSSLEIASAGTITALDNFILNTDLFLTSGILNDGGKIITVSRNIQGSGTHISVGLGQILMTGSGTSIIGGANLYNIEISSTASISSTFPALGCAAFISGKLTMNGGNLGIGLGNTLTMKNGSSIYRTSGNLNLNGGTMAMGESATDTISVTINADLLSSNELPGSPVGKIDLTINDGFTYTLKSNNKTVRNLYLYSGQLSSDPTDLPLIYGITSTGTATLAGDYFLNAGLNIRSILKFDDNVSGKTLDANGFLTFKSISSTTGSLAPVLNGNNITNDAIVERYIQNKKGWRLLYMPTQHTSQNIQDAWQEGGSNNNNPNPGYGIQITSNDANWQANGFDTISRTPSVKYFEPSTNDWVGIPSTSVSFDQGQSYMAFIRGNRSVTSFSQASTSTTLREIGNLHIGDVTWSNLGTAGSQFVAIGNPYPSAISLLNITKSNLANSFYVWDPVLTGTNGFGAYQTLSVVGGNVVVAPSLGGSYITNTNIESGQGFFVRTTGGPGSITFHETDKAVGSNLVARAPVQLSSIRMNLFKNVNNEFALMDGVMHLFDSSHSNDVNTSDAMKLFNPSENIAIKLTDKNLSIEARCLLNENDTLHYAISQMKLGSYKFEITPEFLNANNLSGLLVDNYLHVTTPVSLINPTSVSFDINNDVSSYAPNRFYMIFKSLRTTPIKFIDVSALEHENNILVSWNVEIQININRFIVEKSIDGINFNEIGIKPSTQILSYSWLDDKPVQNINYYRIKSISDAGEIFYSKIVKVSIGKNGGSDFTISPNPVTETREVNIDFVNFPTENYQLVLYDYSGRKLFSKNIFLQLNNNRITIKLKKSIPSGNYNLILSSKNDKKLIKKLLIK